MPTWVDGTTANEALTLLGECLMPRWIIYFEMNEAEAIQAVKDMDGGTILGGAVVREEMEDMGHLENPFTEEAKMGLVKYLGVMYGCWTMPDTS